MITFSEFLYFLNRRITNIMAWIFMFILIKRYFKRKNGKHFVYIPLDVSNTIFFPCPNLRRYVIKNRYLRFVMNITSDVQIETRIINQNDHIRIPFNDIISTKCHILDDDIEMQQYRNKAHIG